MASIIRRYYTRTDPVTGKNVRKRLRTSYIEYRDAAGILRRGPGFVDRGATEQLAAELERKAERQQSGLADPFEEHRKRPLLCARCRGRGELAAGELCDCPGRPHLADFRRFLEAKGNTP